MKIEIESKKKNQKKKSTLSNIPLQALRILCEAKRPGGGARRRYFLILNKMCRRGEREIAGASMTMTHAMTREKSWMEMEMEMWRWRWRWRCGERKRQMEVRYDEDLKSSGLMIR